MMQQEKNAANNPVIERQGGNLPKPVVIIASRESGGSLLSALLGAHPDFYGAPHLNLLAFEEVWQLLEYTRMPRDSNIHGLLRVLGELLIGEQTIQSIQTANRWISRRSDARMVDIHASLRSMTAPRRLVDYSPLVAQNRATMERAIEAIPDACFIHLTRNPWAHGKAMSRPVRQTAVASLDYWDRNPDATPCMDVFEIGEQWVDWSAALPVFDSQFAWYRTQSAARDVLADLPADRAIHLDLNDLLAAPGPFLAELLAWLGADTADAMVKAMLNAGIDRFDRPGPHTAPFGVDFEMLGVSVSEALDRGIDNPSPPPRESALPWRGDGEPMLDKVIALANDLGYGADK